MTHPLPRSARILLAAASLAAASVALCLALSVALPLAGSPPALAQGTADADERDLSQRLVEIGKVVQQSEGQQTALEAKLAELGNQEARLRGTLEQRHGEISMLLAALQRMGRNPPPVMITRREDALTMVRSAMLLSSAFPQLKTEAEGLAKELNDLAQVIKTARDERDKLTAEKTRYDAVRIRLAALQDEKRRSGADREAEIASVRQEVARLARGAEEISDFLPRAEKEVSARVPMPAAPPAGAQPSKGPAVLAPSRERVASLASERLKPNIPFEQTKGTLQLPSQGVRTVSFGQKTSFGTLSKGIYIQTRYGGTVIAPCDGLVVYAGEFRAYGQLLIISPGGGYHILLAGLSQIDVQVGQSVLMGEPVGAMTSAPKAQAGQDSGPVLQIEFRKDQKPIDPDPWWSDASRKVQG